MSRALITAALLLAATAAHADDWHGADKALHLRAGTAIALAGTTLTGSPLLGMGLGCGAGLAKEMADMRHRETHDVSAKDAVVTCLGASLGAATGLLITPGGLYWSARF